MAYQENVEVYLTLSLKELQGLCRKHRLPDNKSKIELARLLVEFFTRRALLKEKKKKKRSLKDQGPAATRGERKGKGDVSGANRPAAIPSSEETAGGNICAQMAGQFGSTNQVLNMSAENVLIGPSNHVMEGLDCSTSESLQTHIKPPLALGIHESVAGPSPGHEYVASCDGNNLQTLFNRKITGQNLPSSNTSLERDGNNLPLFKFRNRHSGESFGESGLDVSNENSGEAYPSFQFFIRADEGINLFVDLNSSPSEWVKKLKCEVCIYQNPQKNSWSISNGIRESGKVEEHLKISYPKDMEPSNNISTTSHLNELGAKDECTMSSLKPIFGLECNSAVSSNGIFENSPAIALACDNHSKEQAECLARGNQTVSSLEMTSSDMKHGRHICPQGFVEKHDRISSVDNECHSLLPDGSSVTNLVHINYSTDTIRLDIQDPSEHVTIEVDHVNSRTMTLCSPDHVPSGVCDKRNTPKETTITNISEGINHARLQGNRQWERKESINLPNDSSGCCSVENSVSRAAVPVLPGEPGIVKPLPDEDPLGPPEFRSSQLSRNKRSRSSETLEENRKEKQCADAAHLKDPVQRFRLMKSPAKERLSDSSSQPRRSTRLVSK